MPDRVRKDDKMFGRVQQLSGTKQKSSELFRKKLLARSASAVHDQHRIIPVGLSDGAIVQAELRQRLAARETEVANHEVGFLNRWIFSRSSGGGCDLEQGKQLHAGYCTWQVPR